MKFDLTNNYDRIQAEERFRYLLGKSKQIELKEIRKTRSLNQNSYLHVVISLYGIHFGYTLEEAKVHLKRRHDPLIYEDKNGEKFLLPTSKLNTKEMTIFIEWIRNRAGLEGCYIPSSEDYLIDKFRIDKEIDLHKQYL